MQIGTGARQYGSVHKAIRSSDPPLDAVGHACLFATTETGTDGASDAFIPTHLTRERVSAC